jgi:hypothetical protein
MKALDRDDRPGGPHARKHRSEQALDQHALERRPQEGARACETDRCTPSHRCGEQGILGSGRGRHWQDDREAPPLALHLFAKVAAALAFA